MKIKSSLVPVRNILRIIDSCQTEDEINNCKEIVAQYVKTARKKGVDNLKDLQDRLDEEVFERQEELYLARLLNK